MSSNNTPIGSLREELAERIYQFLRFEYESNSQHLSEISRESLNVAAECVEHAFELSKPQSERPPSDELLHIYTKYARGEEQIDMSTSKPQQSGLKRKNASSEDKKTEESKNQGDELMKQDKHKEACESYTKTIELDENNAVYYSSRAAAHTKLGDHQRSHQLAKENGDTTILNDNGQKKCPEAQPIKPGISDGIKSFQDLLEKRLRENDVEALSKRPNESISHRTFLKKGEGLKRFASFKPPMHNSTNSRFALKAVNQNLCNSTQQSVKTILNLSKPPPVVVHDPSRPISRRQTFVKFKTDKDSTCLKDSNAKEIEDRVESASETEEPERFTVRSPSPVFENALSETSDSAPRYNLRRARKPCPNLITAPPQTSKPKRARKKKATAIIECHVTNGVY